MPVRSNEDPAQPKINKTEKNTNVQGPTSRLDDQSLLEQGLTTAFQMLL